MTINLVNMGNGTYAIQIGDKFLVDYEGNLKCINANVAGTITATAGTIGGCNIDNGKLQISEANISGKLTANVIDGSNLNVNSANIADSVSANWVYAGAINADNITAGTLNADRINASTLSWDKLIGYAPATKISDDKNPLTKLNVSNLTTNTIGCGTTIRIGGSGSNVTIGGAKIKLNTGDGTSVEGAWADIIKGATSTTKTAVFG